MAKRWSFCLSLLLLLAAGAHDGLCRRPVLRVPREAPTTGRYIVVLKEKTSVAELQQVLTRILRMSDDSKVYGYVEKVAKAFTVKLSSYSLELVRHLPEVDYIEEEGIATGTQDRDLPWYLDRIDQSHLPLDYFYNPIGDGSGADVYILDSGINYNHDEFEYRAKYGGYDPVDEYEDTTRKGFDCHGHGTHVASLCGGKTYGSAKKVTLYSIRVLRCDNTAPWSVVLNGLDYVARIAPVRRRPAIVSMSLGGSFYHAMNDAVAEITREGIHVITVAGNGKHDSCTTSPGSSRHAVTVAGSRNRDGLYLYGSGTNHGECVDIFAPGQSILAADAQCHNCSKYLSGTSMAAPLVSGVAAIHLSQEPLLTPSELKEKLITESIKDVIDYTGMPSEFRSLTPNRLVHLPGSCGGNNFLRSHDKLTSPNYPQTYPNNLHCMWTVISDTQQHVLVKFTYLSLEENYDVLRIYDGFCCNNSKLIAELTGEYGTVDQSFRSTGKELTFVLTTDSTEARRGFNATYTKIYAGTDLVVPSPDLSLPTPSPSTPLKEADIKVFIKWPTRQMKQEELPHWEEKGYKIIWATTYRVGPAKSFFDVVLSNSSNVDTRGYLDLNVTRLNQTIRNMDQQGYSVWYLSDRDRGKEPTAPHYSVVFRRTPMLTETEVYLRDNITTYLERREKKKQEGYQLISHSFCYIQGKLEAASVYVRDRRLAFNITVDNQQRWESYHNLTFFDFTSVALRLSAGNFYPSFVEVYQQGESDASIFAAIFQQRLTTTTNTWFRWGWNTTSANQYIQRERASWNPFISAGYNYNNNVYHFVVFERKSQY